MAKTYAVNNNKTMSAKNKGGLLSRKSSLSRSPGNSSKNLDAVSIDMSLDGEKPLLDNVKPPVKSPLTALLSTKNQAKSDANLMLVTVNVLGSPGPLRFLVDKNDRISRVVEMALRVYAREGRLPIINDNKSVELYCHNGDFKALDPTQCVGQLGTRQFLLYRKKPEDRQEYTPAETASGPLKHWWNLVGMIVCS